jgi:cation transport ATPase
MAKTSTVIKLPPTSSKAKRARKAHGKEVRQTRFERGLTITMAGFIPLLSLTLSRVTGVLFSNDQAPLAAFAAVITVTVLSVSLPHLAHAINLITQSGRRVSWALAVAFDLGIVLAEMVHVSGPTSLTAVSIIMLAALSIMSAVLNGIAFTRR